MYVKVICNHQFSIKLSLLHYTCHGLPVTFNFSVCVCVYVCYIRFIFIIRNREYYTFGHGNYGPECSAKKLRPHLKYRKTKTRTIGILIFGFRTRTFAVWSDRYSRTRKIKHLKRKNCLSNFF